MRNPALFFAPILCGFCFADTIRMRDGTEIEGTILSEVDGSYLVMVQVSKTIRDQRTIPKADVLEIVAEKEDEAAYEKIKNLVPTPDLLKVADYDVRMDQVEEFIRKYSSSSQAESAKEALETLEAERKIVVAGGMKFEGKLIPAIELDSKAYAIESRIAAFKFEQLAERGQLTLALRAWDELESGFPTSRAYIDTIPLAVRVMTSQLAALNESLETFDERTRKRMDGIARIPEKDRARSEQAIEEESAAYMRRVAWEKENGIDWVSLNPFHKEPLTETQSRLEREIQRLQRLDTVVIPDGDGAWMEAWETLNGTPSAEDAREAINAARSARLPKPYLDRLEAKAPSTK